MNQKVCDAVAAYYRLTETLRAAIADPDGYEAALSAAAHETNAAFATAGLHDEAGQLTCSPGEFFALVRELYPEWVPI